MSCLSNSFPHIIFLDAHRDVRSLSLTCFAPEGPFFPSVVSEATKLASAVSAIAASRNRPNVFRASVGSSNENGGPKEILQL